MKKIILISLAFILISCAPEWEEKGFHNERQYTSAINKGFDNLKDWESFSDGNFDNKEQWSNAMKSGFSSKKELLEAEKYNVNTKDSWLAEIDKSKAGGFYSVGNYFKAKELGISTQKELTKYEYNEMLLAGIRDLGKRHASYQKCEDVSGNIFFHDLEEKKSTNYWFYNQLRGMFRSERAFDELEVKTGNFTKKHITAFNQAKNPENMGWDKELANMGAVLSGAELAGTLSDIDLEKLPQDNKMLNNYLETNCLELVGRICSLAQIRHNFDATKQVKMSGEEKNALMNVTNYCSVVKRGNPDFNHWNKYFLE